MTGVFSRVSLYNASMSSTWKLPLPLHFSDAILPAALYSITPARSAATGVAKRWPSSRLNAAWAEMKVKKRSSSSRATSPA